MPDTGGFDVMLQFKQDIINDILVRVLNESLITNLHLKSPLSRLIDEPVPPTQVKVWWDKPELEFDDADSISLSVDVTGGARQLVTGRNLSVDGSVSITRKALFATDETGTPYLYLEPPQPFDLHMSKLKVTYEGSKWPALLSGIDPTRETTVLRPLLATALMLPLSQLPLSYNVGSLPLRIRVPNSSSTPSEWNIPVTTAMIRVLKQADAVAMGLSLTESCCDHTQITTAFPEEANSNAALTLSSKGINNIIGQLRRRGSLKGVITSSSKKTPVNWQWDVLTIQCHTGYISLTGDFRRNAIPIHVIADLKCSLDCNMSLTITPLAISTDAPTTEAIVSSLYDVLRVILRARARNTRDDDSEQWGKLFQRFIIPGTQIEVEAPADDILIEEGSFTLLYDVPQSLKDFQAEVPSPKPQVTISEPNIPMQTAPGAPVSMQVQAQLTTQSFPPYDYVWTTDLTGKPTHDRGPSMTVTGSPTPAGPGPQIYTIAHVKVIDTFGQVGEASAPVRYEAQTSRQRKQQRSSSARIAAIVAAIIILIFSGIGGFFLSLPTPSLSGPAEVIAGSALQLHGSGFFAGGNVALSLDGQALALSSNRSKTADSLQNRGLLITLAQLTPNGTIQVDSSGNFDATINISATLALGTHSIHASEAVIGVGVRSADMQFNDVQQLTTVTPTPTPTPTPSPTPSPTPVLPTLTVNQATINANTDHCSYGANNGWVCSVSLSSDLSNQSSLDWTASSSGASFSSQNGTLTPTNPTATVTIFVSAQTVCPAQIDLAFAGPANTEHVTWSCAAPNLSVTPNSLIPRYCKPASGSGWDCTVTLKDDEGGATWTPSSNINGVTFNPTGDTVYPGGEPVTITIPNINCVNGNGQGTITFSPAPGGNSATVSWFGECIK